MPKLILIVDDNREILELMEMVLTAEGYEVRLSSARMKDLNVVKELKPDLLIIDQIFGGSFIGWEFIQKMKLERETANILIILCTAAISMVKELQEQLTTKNISVILKPFDIDDLISQVALALDGSSEDKLAAS